MELIRNLKECNICLNDNDKKIFETNHIGAEFIFCLYTNEPIIITDNLDKYLYMNLMQIMDNEYIFDNNQLSYKLDNQIRWFSDQYCDIDDLRQTDKVDRLIIKRIDNTIQISCENPYFEKENIKKIRYIIAFSPSGNGFYSKNVNSGSSFQDDIIVAFKSTLTKEYNKAKMKVYKKE